MDRLPCVERTQTLLIVWLVWPAPQSSWEK